MRACELRTNSGERENMRKKTRWMAWVGILVALALTTGCLTPAGRTAGEVVDDSTVTTMVKTKLVEDAFMSGFAIGVKTFKGEVTLTGAVDSPQAIRRAEELAGSVHGVRRVNNLIQLR